MKYLINIPLMPTIPSNENLGSGITTRVFAKKLRDRRLSLQNGDDSRRSSTDSEQSRRFLKGVTIPNSHVKSAVWQENGSSSSRLSKSSKSEDRDRFVDELILKLQLLHKNRKDQLEKEQANMEKEELDRQAYDKIRNGLFKLNRMEYLPGLSKQSRAFLPKTPFWDEMRISRRTGSIEPANKLRRPTVESIKEAIEKSIEIQALINVDKLEKEAYPNLTNISSISLIPQELSPKNASGIKVPIEKQAYDRMGKRESISRPASRAGSVSITMGSSSHSKSNLESGQSSNLSMDKDQVKRKSILKQENMFGVFQQKKKVSIISRSIISQPNTDIKLSWPKKHPLAMPGVRGRRTDIVKLN